MAISVIRSLLLSHIDDLTLSPAVPVSKPDEPYDPVVGEVYLDVVFQPNETLTPFVGDNDPKQHQGFLQVTVVGPRTSQSDRTWQLAEDIIDHYRKGTTLYGEGGVNVKIIRQPWATPPFPDEGWLRLPVTIPYLCVA